LALAYFVIVLNTASVHKPYELRNKQRMRIEGCGPHQATLARGDKREKNCILKFT